MTAAAQQFPFFRQHSAVDLNLTVYMLYILQSMSLYTGLVNTTTLCGFMETFQTHSQDAHVPEKKQ